MGGFSITHWIIVLVIVLLVFGTKKLRNMGGDLGGAIRNFKKGLRDGEAEEDTQKLEADSDDQKASKQEKRDHAE